MSDDKRLFGMDGDEYLCDSIAGWWESYQAEMDGWDDRDPGQAVVIEWSVAPRDKYLPPNDDLLERIMDTVFDGYQYFEGATDDWATRVTTDDQVARSLQRLREAILETINWEMADEEVAKHVVTWDDDRKNPRVNGEPMYRENPDA